MLPSFVEYVFSFSQPVSMPKFVKKVITKKIKDQPPRMTVDEKRLVREMHFLKGTCGLVPVLDVWPCFA